jgi:hypothetical protein
MPGFLHAGYRCIVDFSGATKWMVHFCSSGILKRRCYLWIVLCFINVCLDPTQISRVPERVATLCWLCITVANGDDATHGLATAFLGRLLWVSFLFGVYYHQPLGLTATSDGGVAFTGVPPLVGAGGLVSVGGGGGGGVVPPVIHPSGRTHQK